MKIPYSIGSLFYKPVWNKNQSVKLLIEVNRYFSRRKWDLNFIEKYPEVAKRIEIKFSRNKFEFARLSPEADFIFCFGINRRAGYGNLRHIYIANSGYDHLDEFLFPADALISDCKGIPASAVAEFCYMSFLMLKNGLNYILRNNAEKIWTQDNLLINDYSNPDKFRIGIAGLGNIGMSTADIFRRNGHFVSGYDIDESKISITDRFFNNITELAAFSDVLIISLPLTQKTKHLVTKTELEKLGKDSYLINVSRGDVINENDLYDALLNHTIKAAVIDTFSVEPVSRFSRFWDLDNVIITPHVSGNVNKFVTEIINDFIIKTKILQVES